MSLLKLKVTECSEASKLDRYRDNILLLTSKLDRIYANALRKNKASISKIPILTFLFRRRGYCEGMPFVCGYGGDIDVYVVTRLEVEMRRSADDEVGDPRWQ